MARWSTIFKRTLIIPPILIGIGAIIWLTSGREPPTEKPQTELARAVRVIEARAIDFAPTAEGFGTVAPARVWSAVAEVAGRIIDIHPELRDGAVLTQGTELLHIDPVDYELTIAQVKAELAELDIQQSNAQASLEIEQRSLTLMERESKRVEGLVATGTLSQNEADATMRSVLSSRSQVQNLRNTLALIPVQRKRLEAQLASTERDLEQTVILAPFTMRVAGLAVENNQYVSTGQTLFEGDSTDRVEVLTQFPMWQMRALVLDRPITDVDLTQSASQLSEILRFRPTVLLDTGHHVAEWEADFVRVSDTVDPQTRTIGIVVAVDDPFGKTIPGVRPPLTKGMFVRVLMQGSVLRDRLLIPRAAIRNGTVYVVDKDSRLQRRNVEVAFNQGEMSVLASGLEPGERVVLSDVVPAVDGMLLRPIVDQVVSDRIAALSAS